MGRTRSEAARGRFVVTLVVDLPIAKPDALAVIAFVSDGEIEDAGTARPRVSVAPHVWAEVDMPRFSEPPPLAVVVCSAVSLEVAHDAADTLRAALRRVGWTVRDPRPGEA